MGQTNSITEPAYDNKQVEKNIRDLFSTLNANYKSTDHIITNLSASALETSPVQVDLIPNPVRSNQTGGGQVKHMRVPPRMRYKNYIASDAQLNTEDFNYVKSLVNKHIGGVQVNVNSGEECKDDDNENDCIDVPDAKQESTPVQPAEQPSKPALSSQQNNEPVVQEVVLPPQSGEPLESPINQSDVLSNDEANIATNETKNKENTNVKIDINETIKFLPGGRSESSIAFSEIVNEDLKKDYQLSEISQSGGALENDIQTIKNMINTTLKQRKLQQGGKCGDDVMELKKKLLNAENNSTISLSATSPNMITYDMPSVRGGAKKDSSESDDDEDEDSDDEDEDEDEDSDDDDEDEDSDDDDDDEDEDEDDDESKDSEESEESEESEKNKNKKSKGKKSAPKKKEVEETSTSSKVRYNATSNSTSEKKTYKINTRPFYSSSSSELNPANGSEYLRIMRNRDRTNRKR